MIKKGDIIHIRPEWRDANDDKYIWIATEDQIEGRDSIGIMPLNTGLRFPPVQLVRVTMIDRS
jgi:hypothetical protein